MAHSISEHDKSVLRQLAEQKANIAALAVQQQRIASWQRLNDLRKTKPLVWINEIPWNELGIEKTLQTENTFCRETELKLRMELYQWEQMQADMVVEPVIYSPIVLNDSGFAIQQVIQKADASNTQGVSTKTEGERKPQVLSTEPVYSKHFEPQIKEDKDIEKIKPPNVTLNEEATERNFSILSDIFGDILPVKKRGAAGFWFAPWDDLVTWWGVQEALMDLALRPDMVKAAMDRLVSAHIHRLDQYEQLNALSLNNDNTRIGSGAYGYTSELPQDGFDKKHVRPKNLWGCATAQIFCDVSPKMHREFALDYEIKWLERFGLNYYGCCEPLHRKIDILKAIPNLRKISISPWADLDEAVKNIGTDYVISYKPSPAILAIEPWDPNLARTELKSALDIMRGCHVEIIMKDISTVRNEPQRLWQWAQIASELTEGCTSYL